MYNFKSVMPCFIMYFKSITGNVVQVNGLTIPNFRHSDNASQTFELVVASKAVVARTPNHTSLSNHNGNGFPSSLISYIKLLCILYSNGTSKNFDGLFTF